jgi:hypothetical protein
VLFRMTWSADARQESGGRSQESRRVPGSNAVSTGAAWRIEYTLPRENGVHLTVAASGGWEAAHSPWLADHLFQTLTALCRHWPLAGVVAPPEPHAPEPPAIVPLPARDAEPSLGRESRRAA